MEGIAFHVEILLFLQRTSAGLHMPLNSEGLFGIIEKGRFKKQTHLSCAFPVGFC